MTVTDSATKVRAGGLDGSNPLGFLAAIGLLRVLATHSDPLAPAPTLSWMLDGHWQPVFTGPSNFEAMVATVLMDRGTWTEDAALLLACDAEGELVDPRLVPDATRDLKPAPTAMRQYLDATAATVLDVSATERKRGQRTLAMAAAYGSDVVQDNNGRTKPTALHFTAGQQRFLTAIAKLQSEIREADVVEALAGPWTGCSMLPSMSWDATVARNYALRASNPSNEKRGSNPGADWLAFVGLSLTRAVPVGHRLLTTGVRGGWTDSAFTWPIWDGPLSVGVVTYALHLSDLPRMSPGERCARGIAAVYRCGIIRSDQGGYGSFAPADVL